MSPTNKKQNYGTIIGVILAIVLVALIGCRGFSSDNVKANTETTKGVTRTRDNVYYNGDYYNDLEGLDKLLDGTYSSQDVKIGLRALIGYESVGNNNGTYVKAFDKNIVGTDKVHPKYKGTAKGSLAEMWLESERMDNDSNPNGYYRLFYSNVYGTSLNDYKAGVNREHVWPQSLSGGLYGTSGAGADGHHIRPTNSQLNGARSNKRYGDLDEKDVEYTYFTSAKDARDFNCLYNYVTEDDVKKNYNGQVTGYSNDSVFEPRDEYKGDIARIIAYMALHYESLEKIVDNVMVGGYDTIIKWNKLDPVDSYEIHRNNIVAEFQGNRNPFIDAPELVDVIFG